MGREQKQPSRPSALLGYITSTQQSFQRNIDHAQTSEERKDEQIICNVTLWEADAAQKYRLTSSALAMVARLKPEQARAP